MKDNLLLLHGALGTKQQFQQLEACLSDQFEVYMLDFAGHGTNSSSEEFSIDLFTENVIDFLAENKIERTHIFGYSMGGYVGLNLARKSPELVGKIITLGTKFDWTKETAEQEMKMLNPEVMEEKVPAFAEKLVAAHSHNNWKEVVRKTASMMYGLATGNRLTPEDLQQVKQDVLIGIGSKDRMVSIEESQESANLLPNGVLRIIEDFQHPIERVDVEELGSIIVDFIKSPIVSLT